MEKINVLCIEDDEVYREQLKRNICSETFNCYFATTLQEGIEVLKIKNIELVLLDLILPDSPDADHSINQILSKFNLPIIILSGLSKQEIKEKALQLGVEDYISKDKMTKEVFVHCAKRVINKSRRTLRNKADEIISKLNLIEKSLGGVT